MKFFLELCVLSVEKAIQNIEAEIIVVDNNSSDESCAMIKQRFPEVKLIENKENLGFPKGNNIGVKAAQGDFICILNPDTIVAEDTFQKIVAFAASKKNLGIVGCKLIDGTGVFLPESKRGTPTPWVAFTKILGLYSWFPKFGAFTKYYAQHVDENQSGKVDVLVGAFMIMKRALYNEIGGFDENCFMYSDDIDLSYTVLQKGKANYYFHETTVIHFKGESTIKDGVYMKRFQEAMHFFYNKHLKRSRLRSFFFTFFMQIGILFFTFFKRFQGQQIAYKKPSTYLLFGKEEFSLTAIEKIKEHTGNSTIKWIKTTDDYLPFKADRVEILFDIDTIGFKEIIHTMQMLQATKTSFKFYNKQSGYLIGSYSRNDRGQIIQLNGLKNNVNLMNS